MLKERQQGALHYYGSHFFGGLPFLGAQKVAANVDQSLDLIVPLLGVLEVSSHIECLPLLARVADSLALLLLCILLWFRFLGLLLLRGHLIFFSSWLSFLLFKDPWLLTADHREPLEDSWEETARQRLLSELQATRHGEDFPKDPVVDLYRVFLFLLPVGFLACISRKLGVWLACQDLEQELLALLVLQE